MSMDEIDSFLSFLTSVKGESENTRIGYENDLRQFGGYLERLRRIREGGR